MSNNFTKKYFTPSVQRFVSTVLLIDDQLVYNKNPQHNIGKLEIPIQGNAKEYGTNPSCTADTKREIYVTDMIRDFSKEKLLLTPINPNSLEAKNKKACMFILSALAKKVDVIILDWDMSLTFENDTLSANELACSLIKELQDDNKYRLVFIYTADRKDYVETKIDLVSKNLDIKIYGKEGTTGTDVKRYDELAKQVNADYLSSRSGLLGSALLSSLTALRESTYSMLSSFDKNFDKALLCHKRLLTNSDKIYDFIYDIIKDEILSQLDSELIKKHIPQECFVDYVMENKDNLAEIEDSEIENLLETQCKHICNEDKKNVKCIIKLEDTKIMPEFSYYSLIMNNNTKPHLQLGCIVQDDEHFLLCIQPLCDSERIDPIKDGKCESPRKFIFLELQLSVSKIDFFIKQEKLIGMRILYKDFTVFPFSGNDKGVVEMDEENCYKTYSEHGTSKKLKFIGCLKPMFAQKIANEFAANISRVGIDQFEWLRIKGRG